MDTDESAIDVITFSCVKRFLKILVCLNNLQSVEQIRRRLKQSWRSQRKVWGREVSGSTSQSGYILTEIHFIIIGHGLASNDWLWRMLNESVNYIKKRLLTIEKSHWQTNALVDLTDLNKHLVIKTVARSVAIAPELQKTFKRSSGPSQWIDGIWTRQSGIVRYKQYRA